MSVRRIIAILHVDRSDWSRRSPTVIRVLNRFRSVNMISCGVSLPHPINIKGHGRLGNPIDQNTKQIYYFIIFTFLPRYPIFPTSTCCSSLVSMAFEDALAGLPRLGQPYARLPRRGSSRVSVRRIVTVLHADWSDHSTLEALQGAPPCTARSSAFVCCPEKALTVYIISQY